MALTTAWAGVGRWQASAITKTQTMSNFKLKQILQVCQHQPQITLVRHAVSGRERREQVKKRVTKYANENAALAERVYVWGNAATGALGIKSYLKPEKNQNPIMQQNRPARLRFMDEQDFKVVDVACGYGFTLYLVKRGRKRSVLGTGINTDSQLGLHEVPKRSGRILDYLIGPAVVGVPVEDRDNTRAVQVACGRAHGLILTDKEGVFSLGNNAYGQCGRPVVEGEVFSKVSNVQRVEGLPDNIVKVTCGQDHSLFLTDNGEVYSCGMGADGQTGLGTYDTVGRPAQLAGDIKGVKITEIKSTADCVLALSESGELYGWGNSEYSQLSMVTEQTQVNVPRHLPVKDCGKLRKVAAGGSICAVLNDQGQVFVWGYGILGKGPAMSSSVTPSLIPLTLFGCNELQPDTRVTDIQCGLTHFAALTDKGDVYTWGKNKQGCLGLANIGLTRHKDQYFPLKVSMPAQAYRIVCGVDHMVTLCRSFC